MGGEERSDGVGIFIAEKWLDSVVSVKTTTITTTTTTILQPPGLCLGLPGKGKTNLDLLEQETVSGSGISRATSKSAPHLRQITMPASHHLLVSKGKVKKY